MEHTEEHWDLNETLASDIDDKQAFSWLADFKQMKNAISSMLIDTDQLEDDLAKASMDNKLNLLNGLVEDAIYDLEDLLQQFSFAVEESGDYPVLFRGKIKPFKWIDTSNIKCEDPPINPKVLDLAKLVGAFIPMKPIRVRKTHNGLYTIDDGLKRFAAFRLNGVDKIPAFVHDTFKEALNKTGKENQEAFKKLA